MPTEQAPAERRHYRVIVAEGTSTTGKVHHVPGHTLLQAQVCELRLRAALRQDCRTRIEVLHTATDTLITGWQTV